MDSREIGRQIDPIEVDSFCQDVVKPQSHRLVVDHENFLEVIEY